MQEKSEKIGIFTYDFFPFIGGAGKVAYEHFKYSKHKNKMLVFSTRKNNISQSFQIKIPDVKFRQYDFSPILLSFYLFFNLKKIISKYGLNKIMVHGGPGGIIYPFRVKSDVKVYFVSHHTYAEQIKHLGNKFFYSILFFLEKKSYVFANKVFAKSQSTFNSLINDYHLKNIQLSSNGINLREYKALEKKKNSIVFVGRLEKRKGVNLLIEIMRFLPSYELNIIGDGSEKSVLLEKIKEFNLQDRIHIHGRVSKDKLLKTYGCSEICIVPSFFEGFGLTVLEAMASECLVFASNVEGINDLIKDRKNGILISTRNPEDWSKKIISTINKKQLKKHLIDNAKRFVKKYDWRNIIRKLDENI